MAVCKFPDWSISSIQFPKKPQNNIFSFKFNPSWKISLPFFSFPSPNFPTFQANSSGCPTPILDQIPRSFHFDFRVEDSQQNPQLGSENLNELICQMLRDPRTESLAYRCYEKATERGDFRPESSMLKILIRYLLRSKNWDLILAVSDDFGRFNVFPDRYTCSILISSCIKARKFRAVDCLLENVKYSPEISVLAFDSAMRGYNKLHMYGRTLSVYEKMKLDGVLMDSGCYLQIMKAYQKIGDADKVVALFNEFESRKFNTSKETLARIYRVLCEALGKSGRAFEALEYFGDMRKKGISGDSRIYSSLICSFASIREVNVAEELLREAEEKKMLRDPEIFLKLVLLYVDEGKLEKTLEIVQVMKRVKIRVSDCIFCAIVNGFSRRRGFRAAVRVFENLRSEGCEPGQVTYASIINAYFRTGLYSKAEKMFLEMQEKGFDRCVVAYSSIIAMYGKTGRLIDAMRLVAKMKLKGCEPNVWIYNSLLDMHGRLNDLRQVEKIWKEMQRRKVTPDKVTYTSMINAYSKADDLETCVKYYQEYRTNGGVIDRAMGGIMVGVFSKMGQIDELLKLLQDMRTEGTQLDRRLYQSAYNALRDSGLQMQAKWLQESFEGM